MVENLIHAFLRAQAGSVRRKAKGAMLEVVAFGMIGLSVLLLFFGMFLWLSARMEPWLSAALLAALALFLGIFLMLLGRSLLKRKETDPHEQAMSAIKAIGLFPNDGPTDSRKADDKTEPGLAMVASALAAGLILGRSINR